MFSDFTKEQSYLTIQRGFSVEKPRRVVVSEKSF